MKKKKNLLSTYKRYTLIPAVTVAIVLLLTIALMTSYAYTSLRIFILISDIVAVVALILYIIFYVRLSRKLKRTYFDQLYETTYTNINKIRNNDTNLLPYGDTDVKEIEMLDKATSDIKAKLESSYLLLKDVDYSNINLEYVDKEKNLITYESFKNNIANIIFVSQSFRNVIIDVFFNLPSGVELKTKDKNRLLNLYSDLFKEHHNVLYMFGEDNKSLLIYIPTIDSFSEISEKLNHVVTNSSIMIRDERGIRNILAKFAIVAYPFSNEDMILGDLKYAVQQDKPFYLYLPQRYKSNVGSKLLMNSTMTVNYTTKILNFLSNLDYSATNNEKNDKIIQETFKAICDFIDADEGGIITYNESTDTYRSYVSASRSGLFPVGKEVNKDFVEKLGSVSDEDDAYFFSTRNHASLSLQQILGLYGIQSGIYYVIRDLENNHIIAAVYIFNRNKDLHLNTYLRETFYMMALRIENYFEKREIADYADSKQTENESILALANMYVYHIDDEYNITYLSNSMKKLFPKLKVGGKCYQQMFGLDKRCRDCPFASHKKKYFENNNNQFESSMALANKKDKDKVVFIKSVAQDELVGDLYQEDFLTYSYKALYNVISNEFISSGRGYLVLLKVDDVPEIVKDLGSEGYTYLMRDYIRNLRNKLGIDDIYSYNPNTIAIHLPSYGYKDIITKIEDIFPLSKIDYYENKGFKKLDITYLAIAYPHGFAKPEDFMKHTSDFYHDKKNNKKDFIYFDNYPIVRSASKREFMISTLDKEFSGHNSTAMNLQPIVRVSDGHIYGAEILLRIADEHRNVFFNAQEISNIAEQENMTGMITESIINFVGTMYKEYGNNIFKINKFNRIAINIDQTYLGNKELLSRLIILCEENKLPNGFVSLEIPEEMIPENKANIKALANQLQKYKILFSCDRYLGQYIDIEELANLGFQEVKVARDIILSIENDQVKYDQLKAMVSAAKKAKVGMAAVGVENENQLKLLKAIDEDMMVQGYYLYKPLTRADLITALISYEK